jgi:hypothetical protein
MTALPIILGAKEYKAYLAARTGSTNLINDKLIKTLRMNASLFVEPKTQMLTAVGTEIPCGAQFQPRYSFPSFMVCLLARQEGSKRKPTKDNRYRQLNMARNCPHERLVLTRKADTIFFNAVKNEHFLRNGSHNELHPEVMAKFVPFLQKQAKLTRKRTKSLDSANWTGSLSHVGALRSANPKSGAYTKYGSVDSDIVDYVNRDEVDEDRTRTIKRI